MTLYNRGYGSSRRYGRGGYGMGGVSFVDGLAFGVGMCAAEMNDLLIFFSLLFLSFLSMVATAWMDMV